MIYSFLILKRFAFTNTKALNTNSEFFDLPVMKKSYGTGIEEGRAASKSPHWKFGYFLSVSQQGVSADIIQISAVPACCVTSCHHPPPPPALTPCVITEPGRVKKELSEMYIWVWEYVQYIRGESTWERAACCCLYINIFTWKWFEECAREETAHLVNLKFKSI